jgi:uncharacterized protein YceK
MKTKKNKFAKTLGVLAGMLVMVLALSFVLSGCATAEASVAEATTGTDGGGPNTVPKATAEASAAGAATGTDGGGPITVPKSITITDITVPFSEATVLLVGAGINRPSIVAEGTGSISNGTITVAMKNQDQTDWIGTGSYILDTVRKGKS